MSADARIISGSLVDAKNVGVHKSLRLIIDVPQELAMEVIEKLGWPTMANPIPVAVARLGNVNQRTEDTIRSPTAHDTSQTEPAPDTPTTQPARATPLRNYAQQAGALCKSDSFVRFLQERQTDLYNSIDEADIYEHAAKVVRKFCSVETRSEIKNGTRAEQRWNLMLSAYRVWQFEPSCGVGA